MSKYEPSANYDPEADVLYIFLSGEPSYAREVDDFLLIRIGFWTKEITGVTLIGLQRWLDEEKKDSLEKLGL